VQLSLYFCSIHWAGIIKLFPPRESLVSDIPAEDGKTDNLSLQCIPRNVKYGAAW
jgi:hypothetical protein